MENFFRVKPIGAQICFDGNFCTFMLKPLEAERLAEHLQTDTTEQSGALPRPISSLLEALQKALARHGVTPLWKNEQNCFSWQRDAEWIQLRIRQDDFKEFVAAAAQIPRYTTDPGPPSAEPARRWPCLSDLALLVQMMPAMHKRQGLRLGRNTTLEIAELFSPVSIGPAADCELR